MPLFIGVADCAGVTVCYLLTFNNQQNEKRKQTQQS